MRRGVGERAGQGAGEGDGGGEAGVAGVLPVDVPARGEVELQGELDRAVFGGVGLRDEGGGVARGDGDIAGGAEGEGGKEAEQQGERAHAGCIGRNGAGWYGAGDA